MRCAGRVARIGELCNI